jgi:hypothetical protein
VGREDLDPAGAGERADPPLAGPDELGAELEHEAARARLALHPAADPLASLEHDRRAAGGLEPLRRRQPG